MCKHIFSLTELFFLKHPSKESSAIVAAPKDTFLAATKGSLQNPKDAYADRDRTKSQRHTSCNLAPGTEIKIEATFPTFSRPFCNAKA